MGCDNSALVRCSQTNVFINTIEEKQRRRHLKCNFPRTINKSYLQPCFTMQQLQQQQQQPSCIHSSFNNNNNILHSPSREQRLSKQDHRIRSQGNKGKRHNLLVIASKSNLKIMIDIFKIFIFLDICKITDYRFIIILGQKD